MRKRLGFQEISSSSCRVLFSREEEGRVVLCQNSCYLASKFLWVFFSGSILFYRCGISVWFFVLFFFCFVGAFWAMEEVIEEELMALESIFYDSYSKLSDNRFRIRIDPDVEDEGGGGDLPPPLFLEVLLPEGYPETLPQFDVSNINNRKYPESVKSAIVEGLLQQVC